MYHLKKEEMSKIVHILDGWNETILWSCLQGYAGAAWTDDIQNPQSAQIWVGDFIFYAGKPDIELVKNIPADFSAQNALMIPRNEEWSGLIEQVYTTRAKRFMRYAIKKESDVFDRDKLSAYIERLPSEYKIAAIDENLYNRILSQEWSRDLCSQFPTYSAFEKNGMSFAVMHNDSIAGGASSYSVYNKGIEIEIDTHKDHRRKGIALACASKLILTCLDRGLYPSWDAANMASVALAEKLGYHFDKEYPTYSISNFRK